MFTCKTWNKSKKFSHRRTVSGPRPEAGASRMREKCTTAALLTYRPVYIVTSIILQMSTFGPMSWLLFP